MLTRIITACFYILFAVTPLLFTSINHELFEYNKMMLVYFLSAVITGTWLLKMVQKRQLILKRSPLDIPMGLFLIANILSTITSIDPHTSIWGYYTRSNGGLLSTISYVLLFFALISNFTKEEARKFLVTGLVSGLVVSLYAIPEHFGVSPSCVILYNQYTASCWIQDVQARVFATLGQPNWLAAYLLMLIFPAVYMAFQAKVRWHKIFYIFCIVCYYLAFTFTYSRGSSLGFLTGIGLFALVLAAKFYQAKISSTVLNFRFFGLMVGIFLVVNIFFGSALTRFQLLAQSAPPPTTQANTAAVTQLENGGTESGQIRLIVWKGALEIFKHYPIFGSGLETFAYSYYQYRPVEHNLVSEWDFLYNKAHNEFLNYLATTGLVGFLSYMAIIVTFILWSLKQIFRKDREKLNSQLLVLAILCSYIGYLIQNFFGFSVVIIALFFFVFPAFSFLETDSLKNWSISNSRIVALLDRRKFYGKTVHFTVVVVIVVMTLNACFTLARYWVGDVNFAKGSAYSDANSPGAAYNYLVTATQLNSGEPLYLSERGYAAAAAASGLMDTDATLSGQLKDEATILTDRVIRQHPKNVSLLRTAIRTYYEMSTLDQSYNDKTLQTFDKAIALAPTDAKLYYNKGLVLQQLNRLKESEQSLESAIQLKPNYRDAYFAYGIVLDADNQRDLAIEQMKTVQKLIPNDPEATSKLKAWGVLK